MGILVEARASHQIRLSLLSKMESHLLPFMILLGVYKAFGLFEALDQLHSLSINSLARASFLVSANTLIKGSVPEGRISSQPLDL